MNKKIITILSLVILFIGSLVVFYVKREKTDNVDEAINITPTISVRLATPIPTRVSLDPDVIFPTLPPKLQAEVDGIRSLKRKLPLNLEEFNIGYDYHSNKFIVKFINGRNAYKISSFKNWLKSSGYSSISLDYFEFSD